MTSLLSNDFDEEFFRIEKNLTTNEQTFYIDRENKLIYTTPFETVSTIIDKQKIVIANNKSSQNVNIIMDSITLLSTNPNIQNYTPVKIALGNSEGSKPVYEFDTTYTPLNDYKIVVNPEVNLNTVSNYRYNKSYNGGVNAPERIDKLINIVQCFNIVFTLYESDGKNRIDKITYQVDNGQINYKIVTAIDDDIAATITEEPKQIYANDTVAVASFKIAAGDYIFYNLLVDPIDIIFSSGNTGPVGVRLIENTLIYWNANANGNCNIFARMNNEDFIRIFYHEGYFIQAPEVVSNYDDNMALGYWPGCFDFRQNKISTNFGREWQNSKIQPFTGTVEQIYFGGSNISEPIITVFTQSGLTVYVYRFDNYKLLSANKRVNVVPVEFTVADADILIKRFNNTAYFLNSDNDVVLYNLDTGNHIIYKSSVDTNTDACVNFSSFAYIEVGVCLTNLIDGYTYAIFQNERITNQVYKLNYNFVERTNPFYLANNFVFSLKLPNQAPVADMEIFKYIFDFRIRYDKTAIELKQPEAITSTDRRRFTRRNRKVGDTEQVLGYVGDEFNVQQFLNLYS